MSELVYLTALQQRELIRSKEISAVELLNAHLDHIDTANKDVNAIVTLVPEHGQQMANAVDQQIAKGEDPGILGGLPVAHKDLVITKGIRTTFGSPINPDFIPDQNELIVDRMNAAGAVTIGKTNTPEWGAGSHTFNPVFGSTRNPYDITRTAGGSSGGAAAALAARMLPIADGSDMGGSLRNPASYCNVVGFRVTPGRVPDYPIEKMLTLSTLGPMARTVADCALLLAALAGPDPRTKRALPEPGSLFLGDLGMDTKGLKVAFSADFNKQIPVEAEIQSVIRDSARHFESLGCEVIEACPDFTSADEAFKTLRAWSFAIGQADNYKKHRDKFKETIIWNIESGINLSDDEVNHAKGLHNAMIERAARFFDDYDFLVLPVTQVSPFPVETEYPTEVDGVQMETYIDWMKSCYLITTTGLPAISVPCGFSADGLPVGIQIVGKPYGDFELLQFAHAFEAITQTHKTLPSFLL